jgi:ubiquinone/menaquinone biosynthesis C-methylase UbiE
MFRSPTFVESNRRMLAFLREHGIGKTTRDVLSLGCGEGRLELEMSSHVHHITGVDLSPEAIESAKRHAAKAGVTNVTYLAGDIRTIELADESFDAIWAPAILHHIDDDMIKATAARCHRWLRPGGVFLSIDPNARRLISIFKGLFAKKYAKYHSPDERELDPTQLSSVFRAAGFDRVDTKNPDYFLNPLAWLFPSLPNVVIQAASKLDAILTVMPIVKNYASSFGLIATKL